MHIESIKIWHWMLIGLAVGLLMAWTRLSWEPGYQTGTITIGKRAFEEAVVWDKEGLREPLERENPPLRNIVVHPQTRGFVVVEFEMLERNQAGQLEYMMRQYFAHQPYEPTVAAEGLAESYPTFRAYLDEMGAMHGHVGYRYAWWKNRTAAIALWGLGGMALIGGVWPLVLNLLIGAGFGPRREEEAAAYDLSRFGQGGQAAGDGQQAASGQEQLEGMVAAMEAEVGAGGSGEPAPVAGADEGEKPVREFTDAPLEAVEQAEGEAKEYGGEFYPTEAHAHEHHDHPQQVKDRAFSLVELLVVIGIIALLVSMLLPTLSQARESAKTLQCANNLRQIGMAMLMYGNDYDNALPNGNEFPVIEYSTGGLAAAPVWGWIDLIWDGGYVPQPSRRPEMPANGRQGVHYPGHNVGIFRCPNVPDRGGTSFWFSYGMTGASSPAKSLQRVDGYREPVWLKWNDLRPDGIIVAELNWVSYDQRNPPIWEGIIWYPSASSPATAGRQPEDVHNRHNNDKGSNYLFADTHVEYSTEYWAAIPPSADSDDLGNEMWRRHWAHKDPEKVPY